MTQALYRRYRPETFADVIGQEHVTAPLQQALRTGRVNHAYLFSGPRGCGKTTSARILARCLNCDQGPTDNPCGTCESCVALARGGAGMVDVVEIDAASHGGVDDARELRERASYGPAQSRYKIYIIDEAHMVTTQGFNALLKIVEEPPEHVKFVFATTEPEKVIGTIRSRTHHYPFRLVPPAQLHTYLESLCQSEGVAVEPGVLSFVVRAGGGSVRDSLSVLDQLIAGSGPEGLTYEGAAALLGFTDAELLDATVTAIGHGDAAEAFAQVDKVIETGLDPRRFVEDLLERLRDLIICAAVPDGVEAVLRGVPTDQIERMRVQAGAFGPGGLSRAADIVNAGLSDMTGATAPRLQLELIIARLLLPGAAGPQGYAARLDRLERRLDLAAAHPSPTGGGASGPAPSRPAQPGPMPPGSTAPAPSPSAPQSAPTQPPPTQSVAAPSATPAAEPSAAPSAAQSPAQPEAGPTHAPPVHAAPAAPTPTPPAPAEPVQPTQSSQPTAGGLDQAAIIRAWPDVVDWLARNKRVTWAFVSENAQPLSFDGSRLVLAITTEGLTETFRRGAHHAFVQEAFMEVLGIDIRVEGVAAGDAPDAGRSGGPVAGAAPITTPAALGGPSSGSTGRAPSQSTPGGATTPQSNPQTGTQQSNPQHSGPQQSGPPQQASAAPRAMGAPGAAPSAPPGASTSRGGAGHDHRGRGSASPQAPDRSAGDWSTSPPPSASAPSWATDGEDPIERIPDQPSTSEPPPPTAPTPASPPVTALPATAPHEVVDDPDAISDDDEDIEASGEVGRAVVERLLGGTVISEDED